MQLVSSFRIVADQQGTGRLKGRIARCQQLSDPGFADCLVQHRNSRGFSYEENHLEEWIAREPSALFGSTPVLLLGSQNYVHLRVKIDLLFVDADRCLCPVELKVERVAKNGGVVPYDLYERQMRSYVEFLKRIRRLSDLDPAYARFTALFSGVADKLADGFTAVFGQPVCENFAAPIREIYVAEDFDSYAREYFERKSKEDGRTVRLVAYKFFPRDNYIEFWDVYQSPEEQK